MIDIILISLCVIIIFYSIFALKNIKIYPDKKPTKLHKNLMKKLDKITKERKWM